MATTPKGLRHPVETDLFDPVRDFKRIAEDVDAKLGGPWTVFTVRVTQTGPVTFSSAVCRYEKLGRGVRGNVRVAMSSAGVSGGVIRVYPTGLPAVIPGGGMTLGAFTYLDAGTAWYTGAVRFTSDDGGPHFQFQAHNQGTSLGGATGATFAAANGDLLEFFFQYESAS